MASWLDIEATTSWAMVEVGRKLESLQDATMLRILEDSDEDASVNPFLVIVQVVVFIYCFMGLAVVCDDYLVPSLEVLCIRWNVREDVAGASFMAFGSAAPEIIVNAISTLKAANASPDSINLGIGAILGSSVIAFSVIPGCCALFSGPFIEVLELKRRPLLRDIVVYTAALAMLISSFRDGQITLMESSAFLIMYFIYGLIVFFSPMVRQYYLERFSSQPLERTESFVLRNEEARIEQRRRRRSERGKPGHQNDSSASLATEATNSSSGISLTDFSHETSTFTELNDNGDEDDVERNLNSRQDQQQQAPSISRSAASANVASEELALMDDEENMAGSLSTSIVQAAHHPDSETIRHERGELDSAYDADAGDHLSLASNESNLFEELGPYGRMFMTGLGYATYPIRLVLCYTCPTCERGTDDEKRYPLSFFVSFLWVSLFSLILSTIVEDWGAMTSIPLSFFGFFLISIGAEIPDTVQSVTVARRGYGSMAVSNAFGSQICNICFGLGLPYTVTLLSGSEIKITDAAHLRVAGLLQVANICLLTALLFAPVVAYRQHKAMLTKKKGAVMLGMYCIVLLAYGLRVVNMDK
mmetsp:Transcript_13005/g.25239  ORF Transcript_13005/g.25239 Transcript_13005/m.25239 type:complete len:589 (-) Transcript_13005:286-2052(-)|eukprot:CAMPEP_0171500106 /NCGR_PEP_ID=MMETSP0958-20121227/8799_1 /TAXON_ID=87120 /ORGANISM="Aurantiochytrium limacinum, Strain ATCCMYA-1381" /LENGTH=588 /DNA_ID=CAMNT_0012034735 /DNA_START=51 /DNA_END=1817 /DNA_ORIENTATION=+